MYPSNKKKKVWREEKERLLKMTLEERRKEYLRDYVPLNTILSWKEEVKGKSQNDEENTQETSQVKKNLSEKVSLYRGDITLLEVDAIVNAANASLLGGGGVDGCIHRAAGPCLLAECRTLNGCDTGHAKITCGYDLPAKYVIHTVGPIARGHINGSHKEDLANCYKSSLKLVKENNVRSVAFPCISTGIYGFPNEPAAVIALSTIKEWLAKNHHEVDRIIFCVFLEVDFKIYKKKMSDFFPVGDNEEEDVDMKEDSEGVEPKALSPPHKKSKAKKPESSKDSSEDENGPEEKPSVEEMEGPSQEAGGLRFLLKSLLGLIHRDGVSAATVHSPASEEAVEVCKDEDSAKDDNIANDSEATDHSVCDQDHPNGQENDSVNNEIKIEEESQSSYMETEELSSNQEDTTIVEQPEVVPLTDVQEEKGGEKAQGEDTPRVPVKSEGSCDTENSASPDVEMNSQVDSVNDPTESQQED
ncbi:PREDICTED: O-acetyl-ADP-ribose deacetylase MACROD2 isoform X1 [Myotis brandtii]|uniref:O-acetyl-ADP-ribose deacetylase MACROD2 isoform X1 n=1 Tax=Myotis brandtii TaxID=109478 RepID=UPI0007041C5A|nr:PREDICTED: O-acetyl-ADP-ribose deacetylase MACROD2 isoform X1 [Myotis brandtii]